MPGTPIDLGPDVDEGDVERAVVAAMREWIPWALGIIDDRRGGGRTSPPRTYQAASDDADAWIERKPPALIVQCPGTARAPERHGRRASYGVWWQVNVAVTAGGATATGTRALAQRHAAAVRRVLVQQTADGDLIDEVLWQGTRLDVVPRKRTVMAAEVVALVHVGRAVDTRGSFPTTPPEPGAPAATHPVVTSRRATVHLDPPPETT